MVDFIVRMCDMTLMTKTSPKPKDLRLQVVADPEFFDKVDDLRKREPDLPGRSELVRRLVERAHASKPSNPGR